jgi:CRISPR/Cas system-associated exonuclease Cas4 (RecB family)
MLPYKGAEAEAGTQVHEAIETALKTRQPLPKHLEVYETTISSVRGKINNARIEQTIYLDKSFQYALTKPLGGFVVKLDVLLLSDDGERAVVMDWKTGKPREDTLQHDCYALGVMRAFPTVLRVTGFNVYLKTGKVGKQLEYERENIQTVQDSLARRIAIIEADKHYAPKPSPLCNWCSANKCKYYPKDKR